MAPCDLVLHRQDVRNVGDLASSPARYFPELDGFFPADLTVVDLAAFDELGTVVVGGGGLLRPAGNSWYGERWRRVLGELTGPRRPALLVLWGLGHIDNTRTTMEVSEFCARADLVGVRDRVGTVPFVPCASAMHPFFDAVPAPVADVAVFHCADRPLRWDGAEALANDVADPASAMAHCASGELLVTNSYHGWYWGTLAGRRVLLVEPRTSKFDKLAWAGDAVAGVDPGALHTAGLSGRGAAHPGALDEARSRNAAFAAEVFHRAGLD